MTGGNLKDVSDRSEMHSRDGTRAAAAAAAALASAVGPVSYAQSLYGAADGNHIAGRIGVAPFDPLTLPVRSMTEEIAMSAESAVAGSGADTRQGLGRAATYLEDIRDGVVGGRRPPCPWTAEVSPAISCCRRAHLRPLQPFRHAVWVRPQVRLCVRLTA